MPDFFYSAEEILREKPANSINENREKLKKIFHMPQNMDVCLKEFKASDFDVMLAYIDGLVDSEKLSEAVIKPLIELKEDVSPSDRIGFLKTHVLYAPQASAAESFGDISREMLSGICVLFADNCDQALFIDLRKFPHRPVNRTNNESVVLGSQEGFVENIRMNISLIRKN
ncbi:MAG: spore germination protein, partial [Clostridia bacterium]|nr:spore germination protein [Clostridia bacterium]